VLEGRIPDRVPIGEFAIDFDTVERIIGHETYLRAKAKSTIAFWEGRHDEVADSYLRDHIELHKKLDLDIVTFSTATSHIPPPSDDPPPRKIDDNTWEDRFGRIYKYSEATADITCVKDPRAEAREYRVSDFEGEPRAPRRDERSWRIMDAVIREFKDEKFICGASGGEVGIILLGGMERGLMRLLTQPEVVRAATRRTLAEENLADDVSIHPDQDAALWGADFGYKTGPFLSPELFRGFFLEANKARVAALHARGQRVLKHCCGNIWPLLDSFVDIGYDAYQSIQGSASMDIAAVKARYGDRLTLWGGVALEHLQGGTPEDVRADVRRAMATAKPGGRFILGSSHSIAVGTKYDNFMAMLDEYHKLADY
jgi:hypothetical protein